MGQGRRQLRSGRGTPHPANLQLRPPSPHGPPIKTSGHPGSEGDRKEVVDGSTTSNTELQSSKAANMFKAVARVGTLLSSVGKSAGQPPAIHLPWSKARVRPIEEGDGGRERVEKGEGEGVRRAPERGVAGRREHELGERRERRAGRDEGVERGREGRGRETVTWGRSNRNGVTGMRNGGGEYRGELPGFPSSHRSASLDGGLVIDGSYFQTSTEAKKPPAGRQKLSEAMSLISLSRRLLGPARVGEGEWMDGKSWHRGGTNGSVGDMSVSASVSEKSWDSRGKDTRRREREARDVDRWRRREKTGSRFRDEQSDSESGSAGKDSHLDFSLSETSSPTSSFTAKHDDDSSSYREQEDSLGGSDEEDRSKTESDSDTDTIKHETGLDSGTEGSQDDDREEGESNEKSARRGERSSRRSSGSGGSIGDGGNSSRSKSAKKSRSGEKSKETDRRTSGDSTSSRYSSSAVSSSRPKSSGRSRSSGSSREKTEEESEEDEESGEEGTIDASSNLSPIIEDAEEEEEEKSSSPDSSEEEGDEDGGGDGDEDRGGFGK